MKRIVDVLPSRSPRPPLPDRWWCSSILLTTLLTFIRGRFTPLKMKDLAVTFTLTLLVSPPLFAKPDLEIEPFDRMVQALGSLNYEGVMVYSHDNRMESLRIVHRVVNGRIQAELESLNGQPRLIKQEGQQLICRLSGENLIAVARRAMGGEGEEARPLKAKDLAPHYLVQSQGQVRVADRPTQVIGILPADSYRYGYRFYLDSETGLPLKLDLVGGEGRVIEQLMFTSLTLNPTPPPGSATEPTLQAPATTEEMADDQPEVEPGWTFTGLPPGFKLILAERTADATGQMLEHLVLSDGLAAISVYVEQGAEEGLRGATRMGAIHAQGTKVAGHQVTIVGEVPAVTVAAVMSALQRRAGSGP